MPTAAAAGGVNGLSTQVGPCRSLARRPVSIASSDLDGECLRHAKSQAANGPLLKIIWRRSALSGAGNNSPKPPRIFSRQRLAA